MILVSATSTYEVERLWRVGSFVSVDRATSTNLLRTQTVTALRPQERGETVNLRDLSHSRTIAFFSTHKEKKLNALKTCSFESVSVVCPHRLSPLRRVEHAKAASLQTNPQAPLSPHALSEMNSRITREFVCMHIYYARPTVTTSLYDAAYLGKLANKTRADAIPTLTFVSRRRRRRRRHTQHLPLALSICGISGE